MRLLRFSVGCWPDHWRSARHAPSVNDEPTYDVRITSTDLWPDAADNSFVHVGVFQS